MSIPLLRERAAAEGLPLGIVAAESLWYLDEVLETALDRDLLRRKLDDYDVAPSRNEVQERLTAVAATDLETEMARFLPRRQRNQLGGDGYRVIRDRAREMLDGAVRAMSLA